MQIIIFKNITITINFPPLIPNYLYRVSKNFSQTTKWRVHHQNYPLSPQKVLEYLLTCNTLKEEMIEHVVQAKLGRWKKLGLC